MIASIPSATLLGVDGRPVAVEVHVHAGLPAFAVVGLPDAACREARDRVRAAVQTSGFEWPMKRITVNLAPTNVRKGGAGLDLAIAIGVLVANDTLAHEHVARIAFLGELGLDGSIRPIPGVVPMVDAIDDEVVVVPEASVAEASLIGRHTVRVARNLPELVSCLRGDEPWPDLPPPQPATPLAPEPDLADVRGQRVGRWALEVSAAGGHHLLMVGPPGSGKTMLARRLAGLLPDLDRCQAIEATRIHSAAGVGLPRGGLIERPPVRAPHHGASPVSMIGGGTSWMRPGEISLAANGVLFLDELGEFFPNVLDALRQPLEEGVVRVARAKATVTFPARFLLVAAMNPCPCGEGAVPGMCRCSDASRARYSRRLSGPLLDRFELRLSITRPAIDDLLGSSRGEPSCEVRSRVLRVRDRARDRGVATNAQIPGSRLDELAPLDAGALRILDHKLRSGALSARGLDGIRRVARTIADLHDVEVIGPEELCAALELRADIAFLERAA